MLAQGEKEGSHQGRQLEEGEGQGGKVGVGQILPQQASGWFASVLPLVTHCLGEDNVSPPTKIDKALHACI